MGQGEGQGGQQGLRHGSGHDDRRGRDLARAPPSGQCQLMGEQFVIGQSLARRGVRRQIGLARRRMQGLNRRVPARPPLLRQPGGVLPLVQLGRGIQRAERQLPHHPRRQPGRGRIDGLDGRNLLAPVQGHDPVGMDDLDLAVEPLDLAGDQPSLALRQLTVDVLRTAAEPDQVDEAGLVAGPDLERHARACRRDHPVHDDVEDSDLALHRVRGLGPAARDDPDRRQEQNIAHQRPRQLLDQGCDLGPHPLQAGDLREQGKENLGPHR